MYKCNDCLCEFEEPYVATGFAQDDDLIGEEENRCPHCNSGDIELMHKCPVCSAWITSNHDYCFNCYDYVEKMLNELARVLETTDEHIEQMICNVKGW